MNQEAKEKAIELFSIYKKYYDDDKAKQKTYDMIDRMIESFQHILDTAKNPVTIQNMVDEIEFYKQVKVELDKL